MDNWYQLLEDAQGKQHDRECIHGERCPYRSGHIKNIYVPHALKIKVERLKNDRDAELRKAKAKAWDEGYIDAQINEHEYRPGMQITNPYRADQIEEGQ